MKELGILRGMFTRRAGVNLGELNASIRPSLPVRAASWFDCDDAHDSFGIIDYVEYSEVGNSISPCLWCPIFEFLDVPPKVRVGL